MKKMISLLSLEDFQRQELLVETPFIESGGSIGAVGCYDCKMLATGETTQHAILLWNALDDDLEDGH